MSRILFALAALAASAPALPAAAAVNAPGTRIVRYADLDLSAPAGRARLEQRIVAAVRTVCGSASSADLAGAGDVQACRTATLASVIRPAAAPVATQPAGTE